MAVLLSSFNMMVSALLLLLLASTPATRAFVVVAPSSTKTSAAAVASVALQSQEQEQRARSFGRRRTSSSVVLFMGWGPEPVWSSGEVAAKSSACGSGKSAEITVAVDPESAAEFKVPGQYVQIRPANAGEDDKPLFLAIASPPPTENDSAGSYEFLVKKTDGNEWLTSLNSGDKLEVSQVMGGGYALEENLEGFKYDFPTQNVLLFATGSGIAPIRSAIESGLLNVAPAESAGGRTCRLYYGERTADDLCYVDKFPEWEKAGIEVVPVLSQPSSDGSWKGRTGYIQNALEEDGIAIPRNSGALLCGMKGMTESVKDLLLKAGVFDGRVLFNF